MWFRLGIFKVLQIWGLVPIALSVECLLRGTRGYGFDSGLRHTKVVKNGTGCSIAWPSGLLGRAKTGQPSVRVMWVGVVSCQVSGHDISVRQHYKSERWAPCGNQTPSQYDWKIVESDIKSEQTNKFGDLTLKATAWHDFNNVDCAIKPQPIVKFYISSKLFLVAMNMFGITVLLLPYCLSILW